jgi:hypothetical protein
VVNIEFENTVVIGCNNQFLNKSKSYLEMDGSRIVVSHFGEFSQDLVNSITTRVEETMQNAGEKKGIVKRMFSLLVEGLQNIRIHGEKDNDGQQISYLIIANTEDAYHVSIANLVKNSAVEGIKERIENLNALELPEIKALYMEVLTNGIISQKGGAGLGFITMAMKSKNKLGYQIEELSSELSFFSLDMIAHK